VSIACEEQPTQRIAFAFFVAERVRVQALLNIYRAKQVFTGTPLREVKKKQFYLFWVSVFISGLSRLHARRVLIRH
jgi:hypothetical protein